MDYKEEYFKIMEALENVKRVLDDTSFRVWEIQDEFLLRFIENNNSSEDTERMKKIIKRPVPTHIE